MAPSPHNVQPWRVRLVDPFHAELLIEKARTLPDEDVTGSFMVLSMGVFVEALSLAAAHCRLELEVELIQPAASFSTDALRGRRETMLPFARLALRPAPGATPEFSLDCLHSRRTSRLPYSIEPVTPDASARLSSLALESQQRYVQITDEARIERVLALNIEAVLEDLNNPPYRNELRGWLRYSRAEAKRRGDGLETRCMNAGRVELWSTFHLSAMLRWPLVGTWFRRRYRSQIGPVATMGFLSGAFWDPAEAYHTGRFLLRFWLECTRLGYYLHPYGNLVTNRPIARRVASEAGVENIWLAFKIGHSASPPASRRRSLEEILVA